MVWLMNRARTNPTAEGLWLSNTGDPDTEEDIASIGVNLQVMKNEFAATPPKPPAAFDVRLYNAAYEHSLYLIDCNCQTHLNQGVRVNNSGFDYRLLKGNVTVRPDHGAYYAVTSASGGYAIPITTSGVYRVAFSGGLLTGEAERTVKIGEYSALLDFNTMAPVASFHAEGPTTGSPPFTVHFTDTTGGAVTTRQWNFGDGVTSTDQNPIHTYSQYGKYSLCLTVTAPCGSRSTTKHHYILVFHQGADVNGDSTIDLADAITALQITAYHRDAVIRTDQAPDVNSDGKTGIEEAIYLLRWLSED